MGIKEPVLDFVLSDLDGVEVKVAVIGRADIEEFIVNIDAIDIEVFHALNVELELSVAPPWFNMTNENLICN